MTTWNPADNSGFVTLSGGDLVASCSTDGAHGTRSTTSKTGSGKYYFEMLAGGGTWQIGVGISTLTSHPLDSGNVLGSAAVGSIGWVSHGFYFVETNFIGGKPTWDIGDVLMVACDVGGNRLYYGLNGTWNGSEDPAAGTGGTTSIGSSLDWYIMHTIQAADSGTYSLTLRPDAASFDYSIPSGYAAWDAGGGGGPTQYGRVGLQNSDEGFAGSSHRMGSLHPIGKGIVGWRKGLILPKRQIIRVSHTDKRAA